MGLVFVEGQGFGFTEVCKGDPGLAGKKGNRRDQGAIPTGQDARQVVRRDVEPGHAAVGTVPFHHRLQIKRAAREGPDKLNLRPVRPGVRQGGGTGSPGRGVVGKIESRGHSALINHLYCCSSASSCDGSTRPQRSRSMMTVGETAQFPAQDMVSRVNLPPPVVSPTSTRSRSCNDRKRRPQPLA